MSGLSSAVQQLQSYGRGNDTLLAHVSPDEAAFIDQIQGGRRVNPSTGLPEYGLLGNILKALVRAAGAVVGFSVGGPLGAAAGAGLTTKLTGGSWNDALQSAALSGVGGELGQGLGSNNWNPLGGAGAGAASGAASAASGLEGTGLEAAALPGGTAAGAAGAAPVASGFGSGLVSSLGGHGSLVGALGGPGGVGAGLAAATYTDQAIAPPLSPQTPQSSFRLNNVLPAQRTYNPYPGDPLHFGANPQGWNFFNPVNPPISYAPTPTMAKGGRVRGYAFGGGVVSGPREPGNGGLPNPQLDGPTPLAAHGLPMPGMPGGGIGMEDPRQAALMRAVMLGYGGTGYADGGAVAPGIAQAALAGYNAMALGGGVHIPRGPRGPEINRMPSTAALRGTVKGPGTGKSDDVPAMLSNDEHVIDAPTVAMAGGGSSDAGHQVMEGIKTEIRSRAGFKNPSSPPPSGIGAMVTRARRQAGVI